MSEAAVGTSNEMARGRIVDIVDDDPSVVKALSRLLRSVDIRSVTYDSARLYLDSVDLDLADCLLLDLQLPEMSGVELLEHLRSVAPDLPVVCMTGREDTKTMERLVAAGAPPCLRKPFDEGELFRAVSDALGIPLP